jgi:hypothetical protein
MVEWNAILMDWALYDHTFIGGLIKFFIFIGIHAISEQAFFGIHTSLLICDSSAICDCSSWCEIHTWMSTDVHFYGTFNTSTRNIFSSFVPLAWIIAIIRILYIPASTVH